MSQNWKWNNGMESRGRMPACLVILASGTVHRFVGEDIPGMVKVVKSDYVKNGKWSNTTYHCVSPEGSSIYSWRQSWEEGKFWPQASWEEAIAEVESKVGRTIDHESFKQLLRDEWERAAAQFDENEAAITSFNAPQATNDSDEKSGYQFDECLAGLRAGLDRVRIIGIDDEQATKVLKSFLLTLISFLPNKSEGYVRRLYEAAGVSSEIIDEVIKEDKEQHTKNH